MRELSDLARELAAELSAADFPNLWRVRRNHGARWWEELHTKNAWLQITLERGRLRITADHPDQMTRAESAESITVDASRTPEAIARDIQKSLLPHARAHFQKCREYTRHEKEQRKIHAATLATFAPYTTHKNTEKSGRHTEIHTGSARFTMYDGKISEFRIYTITSAQALQVLEILKGEL